MNLNQIAIVLRRRWWVVASVLLLTVLAAALTVVRGSDYEATASLLLASPELGGSDQTPSESGATLDPSIIVEIVDGDSTRVDLGSQFDVTDYSVTVIADRILRVEAASDTAAGVVQTADAVIGEIQRVAEDLYAEEGRDATLDILSRPTIARQRTLSSPIGETSVEFFAAGSVLLAVKEVNEIAASNPYTASGETLRVLAEVVEPERVRESITKGIDDGDAKFEIIFDSYDVAPILHVVATAPNAEAAMDTLEAAVAFLDGDLKERQALAGADGSTYLSYQRLVYPEVAEQAGGLQRPIATIVVLGVVAAVSLAVLVDTIIANRKKRRSTAGKHGHEQARGLVPAENPERILSPAESREAS